MPDYYEKFLRRVKKLAANSGVLLPDDAALIVMNNDGLTPEQIVGTCAITQTHRPVQLTPGEWYIPDEHLELDSETSSDFGIHICSQIPGDASVTIAVIPYDADDLERFANAVLIKASKKLLIAAQLLGGGDLYFKEFGHYCFCGSSRIENHGAVVGKLHSSCCKDLNLAILSATRVRS